MKDVIVDFETYYDTQVNVTSLGNDNYVKASEAYCAAIHIPGQEAICGTLTEVGPTCEQIAKDPTVKMWAANSNFDQSWWEKYWPKMANPWGCVLDLGAYHQYPRNLKALSEVVLNVDMDKTVRDEMKGVRFESLTAEEKEKVLQYCLTDVIRTREVLDALPRASAIEERIAEQTRACNRRGVFLDTDLMDRDKTSLSDFRFGQFKRIPWHQTAKPLSPKALAEWCQSKGFEAPASRAKDDEDCDFLMGSNPEFNEVITTLRSFQATNRLIKKMDMARGKTNFAGAMPMDLMYCGAPHTRRWTSRGFNVQNLDKFPTVLWGKEVLQKLAPGAPPEVALAKMIVKAGLKGKTPEIPKEVGWVWPRMWLKPASGKKFLILDYAQVEPRITHWVAGDTQFLEQCALGISAYEAAARAGGLWSGDVPLKHGNEELYKTIKAQEIGLGYGMGWSTYLDNNGHLGEWHWGVDERGRPKPVGQGADRAQREVKEWRARNQKIVKLWGKLDGLISSAARDKSHHLAMELPSGDLLQYFNIKTTARKTSSGISSGYQGYVVKGDFGRNSLQPSLWGGTLTENVIQRISRDIIAEAMVRLDDAGFQVVFSAHDEAIMEIDENANEEEAIAEASKIMSTPPEWAAGLPLAVEGGIVPWYCKL